MKALTILTLFVASISYAHGGYGDLTCFTPQKRHEIRISNNKLTIVNHAQSRSIASSAQNVRTKFIGQSLTKVLTQNGEKHTIHVQNVKSPSLVDDYLSVRSAKGHIMTYPLECN